MAKIASITKDGVTLSRIDYSARLSEETSAFTACCECAGAKGEVSNEGRGGANRIQPEALRAALEAHAATLPPLPSLFKGEKPLAISADLLVSLVLEAALRADKDAKMKRQGYAFVARCPGSAIVLYFGAKPTSAQLEQRYGQKAASVTVTAL